ncbi:MAG: SpoIIE family protein phosphatase [Bacteroidetes bacterium]|nr:SpoIIE family protein phosphatase [Bacteroidota bacterium]
MRFRFTIGKKIGAGFGVLILLTLIVFYLTHNTVNEIKQISDNITNDYNPSIAALEDFKSLIAKSESYINNWVNISKKADDPVKKELRDLIEKDYRRVDLRILNSSTYWDEKEKLSRDTISTLVDLLFAKHRFIMSQLNSFSDYEDAAILFTMSDMIEFEIAVLTKQILEKLEHLISVKKDKTISESKKIQRKIEKLIRNVIATGILLLLVAILAAFFTRRSIVKPIFEIKNILLSLGKGMIPGKKMNEARTDEIGEMSVALNSMVEGIKRTTDFANEVGSGNFQSEYVPLSEEDTLGKELLKMRTNLGENDRIMREKIKEATAEILQRKEEIETQRDNILEKSKKLEDAYDVITEKNKDITDSINYARRIQTAIFPPDELVKSLLKDAFILFKPRDIVSGDFYWLESQDGTVYVSAVDCTGHGVPGAFMSIIGYNMLNQAILEHGTRKASDILDELNKSVGNALRQTGEASSTKDGMDIALCALSSNNNGTKLQYSGAYSPLYLIRNKKCIKTKADRFPIGNISEKQEKFTNHEFELQKGDIFYIFTDGYADQFGGPKDQKFKYKQFRELLLSIHHLPMEEQRSILDKTISEWMKDDKIEQTDDILVIGVRV